MFTKPVGLKHYDASCNCLALQIFISAFVFKFKKNARGINLKLLKIKYDPFNWKIPDGWIEMLTCSIFKAKKKKVSCLPGAGTRNSSRCDERAVYTLLDNDLHWHYPEMGLALFYFILFTSKEIKRVSKSSHDCYLLSRKIFHFKKEDIMALSFPH